MGVKGQRCLYAMCAVRAVCVCVCGGGGGGGGVSYILFSSVFAVSVMQTSLTSQFEHSGKIWWRLVEIWLWKIYFHCYRV